MKKFLSILLALIFFFQCLPANVIAEAVNPVPTSMELSAAVALTGFSEDAPGYRSGMEPSVNMNAMQLAGWIHEFQSQQLAYIMDTFENYDVELAYVQKNYPTTFEMLKGFSEAGIGKLYGEYSAAKAWQDDVNYYEDLLMNTASRIDVLAKYLQSGELTEREQVIYAYEMRDKWRALEAVIPEIVEHTALWEEEYNRLEALLTGDYEYSGSDSSLAWVLEEVDNLRGMDGRGASKYFSVSASAVRVAPDQTLLTRLARISPISNALADSSQKMIVKILDDKNFGIIVVDGSLRVSGADVFVGQSGKDEHKEMTDPTGSVMYPIRDFQNDKEGEALVNIRVNAGGYRRLEAPGVWVKKGEGLNIPLQKDDGTAYLVSWSFWDHDMLASKYTVITSPLNDSSQPIKLKVSSPDDFYMKVYFTDKNGKNPITVGEVYGKKGDQTYTFEGQWLMKAQADGKLYAKITCNGQTRTHQAQIELKASVLKKPLGDPNFKYLLNPGFEITLPEGWVKPFGGMKIQLNLPITEKWQLRGYFDINGSGAFTIGTKLLEEPTKNLTQNWKTKDQKALDKAVKEVKGQGYMAETKAKNGGDWAGRSKWSPLKLGAISLDLCFFGFAQVQYTDDGYNYGRIFGKGGAGFSATLKGTYTLMWPLAQLSAYVAVTFTLFPEIAVMVDTYWPSGAAFPEFKKFEYAKGALNIVVRIEIGIEALAGLRGIASLSVKGIGYLEFAFRSAALFDLDAYIEQFKQGKIDPAKFTKNQKDLTIYAGGSVDVILEILWVKAIYALIDPPFKYMLYPEFKRADSVPAADPVQRFIASLLSSAEAAEEERPPEGGGQVDTGNKDLMINGQAVGTFNSGFGKTEVFSMRPLESDKSVPMMLYIQKNIVSEYPVYPVLMATPLNEPCYIPLVCQNGLEGAEQDHYLPTDGYDVIDFDYWVADVSAQGLTTYVQDRGVVPLNDVLFTVCILAKEYHDEQETLADGSSRTVKVPNETWAYVSCYCLNHDLLCHVLLPQERETNNYLAMCYPLKDDDTNCPSAYPRIAGTIRMRYRDEDAVMYQYEVVTKPLNATDNRTKTGYWFGDIVTANSTYKQRVQSAAYNHARQIGRADRFMRNKQYSNYLFFPKDDDRIAHFYLADPTDGSQSGLSDLVYGINTAYPQSPMFKNIGTMDGYLLMNRVASVTYRNTTIGKPHLFCIQRLADGEGYRLMGCKVNSMENNGSVSWTLRDYDTDMPRTDLQWTKLYGRECIYWMETAGQTEDGQGNLFKVRAVWYDETADSMSEPFVIATVQTPSTDGVPVSIYLADNNEGFYFVKRESGAIQPYRFNFQLVTGLKMVGTALTDTLANPGSYDDMLLTVFNNGNIPLSGFDLVAYHEANGRQAEAFETIHLDLLNPSRNTVTLRKGLDGATEERFGENVARAEDNSLSVDGSEYRYGSNTDYYTTSNGNFPGEEIKDLMKPSMLMPNCFKAFNISLLIPQGWEGNHHIYLEADRYYTSNASTFQQNMNSGSRPMLMAARPQNEIISIGRDGTVRKESGGGMLLFAAAGAQPEAEEDFSMYKTNLTFDRIELDTSVRDLSIEANQWDNNGEPMVTLTVTNWAYIGTSGGTANTVVMEAFLDEETEPVFRYSLPDEVSDKETWNFDMPLSLLTAGRSASKVTVKIKGRNYEEVGDVDNTTVIFLDTEDLTFLTQPSSLDVPEGSGAVFHAAVIGGRTPYRYQWQALAPKGTWTDLEGENSDTLTLKAVTQEMNGNHYRLTVTDASDYSAVSNAATLSIKKVPRTGDHTPIVWYAAGILAASGMIVYIMLRKKKRNKMPAD